jgi:hypothetical protein
VFNPFDYERDTLKEYLQKLGHEVVALEEPVHCPVYLGEGDLCEVPCCDAIVVEQHLPGKDAINYFSDLNARCLIAMGGQVLISSVLSPEDVVKAIGLDCKLLFKPVLFGEVEEWASELSGQVLPERELAPCIS